MTQLLIRRAGPLTTIQDEGRFGMLRHGISSSGPMDGASYRLAGALAGSGIGGVEFTTTGIDIQADGPCRVGYAGGDFEIRHNAQVVTWPGSIDLQPGDLVSISPGAWGNYGYLRFGGDIALAQVCGSISTSSRVRLGGLEGRFLRAGDRLHLSAGDGAPANAAAMPVASGPLRVIWGLHADLLGDTIRERFLSGRFKVSPRLDRMGVRLNDKDGVFANAQILSLVSDAMVPGDIQILGDGTPIVLMRDHQPTGGYPRIATIITADLDRFSQLRPGSDVAFESVTVEHAHRLLRSAT